MQQLNDSLRALIDESAALRRDVEGAARARRRENQINLVLIGALCLFVIMTLVVVWQNNSISRDVRRNSDVIADCTNPGGKCYEDGRARTGQAVAEISRTHVLIVQCARLYRDMPAGKAYDDALIRCVVERRGSGG